jgi:Fe-S-cluster containining protein
MTDETKAVIVDCEAGRRLGCRTFCCRLLVQLKPHEREPSPDGLPAKGYVDKDPQGLCVHMDSENWRCKIWEDRPETCREYACNEDFKLQVVVREGVSNIVDLARKASVAYIPRETYIKVPLISEDGAGAGATPTD